MPSSFTAKYRVRLRAVAVVFVVVSWPLATHAQSGTNDWPGFRGPNAAGASNQTDAFPTSGEFALKVAWKAKIGSGYAGVAVADGRAFTAFSDGTSDVLAAFDARTGAEQWRFEMDATYKGHDGSHDGPIATPMISEGIVIGLAPRGRLFALDANLGGVIWSTNLADDHNAPKPHYGFSTSPIVHDGLVMVEMGAKDATMAAFDLKTGEQRWTAGDDAMSFQSPMIMPINGQPCLLASGETTLYGIDPATGTLLWNYKHGGSGPYGAGSMTTVPAGDGRLFLAFKDDSSTVVSMSTSGGNVEFGTLWEDDAIRKSYNVPVYHDGHVYAYSTRFLTCVDAGNGEVKWRSRDPGDGFLVLVDGHLVIMTKDGSVHVVRATPNAYEERSAATVFEDVAWAHPAFAGGAIYMRSLDELVRVDVVRDSDATETVEDTSGEPKPGSKFAAALEAIRSADDKETAVTKFMAGNAECPIIEGDEWIHFVYYGPADDVALGGDMFGARQDRPMHRVDGTDLFYYSMRLEPDARVNYIFIRDYEEMTDPRNDRATTTTILGKDMELSFMPQEFEMSWVSMPRWEAPSHLDDADASRCGQLETHLLTSKPLESDVEFDVYVPAGYADGEERYPVIYVLDRAATSQRARYTQCLDNLIGVRCRPVLAVFLDSAPFMKNQQYGQMLATELIPFVDEKYRTIASPDGRAFQGMGFGAADALFAAAGDHAVARKVACQSPFVFDGMVGPLVGMYAGMQGDKPMIYLDWGKYDLRSTHENWNTADRTRELAEKLRGAGCTIKGGEANDGCDWPSWRNRTDDILAALFPLEAGK